MNALGPMIFAITLVAAAAAAAVTPVGAQTVGDAPSHASVQTSVTSAR